MWRACLAAIVAGLFLTPAAAQVSPLPSDTFMGSPCGTTGYLAPRVLCAADIATPIAAGTLAGSFTSLSASGAVSGNGFVALFQSPPQLGNVTPNTGAFTTLSATGILNANGGIVMVNNLPQIIMNKNASGQPNAISGRTNNFSRWQIYLGDSTAEGGSNAGSNFSIEADGDNGGFLTTPLLITRSTGVTTIALLTSNNITSTEFPGLTSNNQSTGFPGWDGVIVAPGGVNLFMSNTVAVGAANATAATLRIDRGTTGTGGSNGLNPNALTVNMSPGANDSFFEWGISSVLFNRALATTNAQNVAVAGTAFKQGASAVGPSWAVFGQCVDQTGVASPTASCIGAEFDSGTGVNNGGADTNKQRVILQLSENGISGTHIAYGILMGPAVSGAIIDRAINFNGVVSGSFGIGIDFTNANIFSTAAMLLSGALQQSISWANAAGTYTGAVAGSAIYKTSGNVLNFDNWDNSTFLFENGGGVGVKFVGGHIKATTTAPAPTSCGGGSPTITGSDLDFTITEGTTATGCVATFQTAYAAAPICTVSSPNATAFTSYTPATGTFTIVNASASGDVFNVHCDGN